MPSPTTSTIILLPSSFESIEIGYFILTLALLVRDYLRG